MRNPVCFFILALFITSSVKAKALSYFENKIDYWAEGKNEKAEGEKQTVSRTDSDSKFPWKTYLDPKNKEFFREGDYTPPEPFMEIARNPTEENIENWFEFMRRKNEIAQRLDQKMREYMAKSGPQVPALPSAISAQPNPLKKEKLDVERFKLRMYFESTCPHCHRMFGVLKELQDIGIKVEALQVDSGPMSGFDNSIPISKADRADLKKHGISGVPFLLIADSKRKAILPPVQGYHGKKELILLLTSASQ